MAESSVNNDNVQTFDIHLFTLSEVIFGLSKVLDQSCKLNIQYIIQYNTIYLAKFVKSMTIKTLKSGFRPLIRLAKT